MYFLENEYVKKKMKRQEERDTETTRLVIRENDGVNLSISSVWSPNKSLD